MKLEMPAGKIYMRDGRVYEIRSDDWDIATLRRADGLVLEIRLIKDIKGVVKKIEWVDNLGIEKMSVLG